MNDRNELPGRRWLSIALRTLHIAGVVDTAIGLFGQRGASLLGSALMPASGGAPALGTTLMLVSGVGLFALDWWQDRNYWREVAGVFVLLKLLLLVAMMLLPRFAGALFWLLLLSSAVVSHAPRSFRHHRIVR